MIGRAVLDRQTIHIHDLLAVATEFPECETLRRTGDRTVLATPLLREGVPLELIHIRRTEVRPFTDKQITLLETFADQAVIAIENVRLFQELRSAIRSAEALEQQTATSEILGVISQLANGYSAGTRYYRRERRAAMRGAMHVVRVRRRRWYHLVARYSCFGAERDLP